MEEERKEAKGQTYRGKQNDYERKLTYQETGTFKLKLRPPVHPLARTSRVPPA
jgi:hypothetical protein